VESGNYMGTRLIRARTTNRDEAQTYISERHSVHRSCVDLSWARRAFFEKGALFLAVQYVATIVCPSQSDRGSSRLFQNTGRLS
jgi:hypothetical protein